MCYSKFQPTPSPCIKQVDTLVMHPDKHISVPNPELLAALRNRLPEGDQQQYDDLVKLMEGVASFDFMDLKVGACVAGDAKRGAAVRDARGRRRLAGGCTQ